jgi:hypothetical protein
MHLICGGRTLNENKGKALIFSYERHRQSLFGLLNIPSMELLGNYQTQNGNFAFYFWLL